MDLLKAARLVKLTKSGKPFHTLMTLQAKKNDSTTSWFEKFVRMPPGRQCEKFKKINWLVKRSSLMFDGGAFIARASTGDHEGFVSRPQPGSTDGKLLGRSRLSSQR